MKKFFKNQKGFTLVELMITIVIVGILAAVAVPIYTANIKKAKMSECDAALGTVRTALRVYYATNDPSPKYPTAAAGTLVSAVSGLDISAADLAGKYFESSNYTLTSADTFYTLKCTNTDILSTPRTLNELGAFGGGL
ncbi:MAG: prepilin-type N-terminal cleavage/methylation domain-containing protein [Candidatus Marinimicrobia bacterium]|nr:prepilin-type N-terminal cleavage/methylation domain-containing protein [Candidatus Neomarinimicrobiota bacterium]